MGESIDHTARTEIAVLRSQAASQKDQCESTCQRVGGELKAMQGKIEHLEAVLPRVENKLDAALSSKGALQDSQVRAVQYTFEWRRELLRGAVALLIAAVTLLGAYYKALPKVENTIQKTVVTAIQDADVQ